MPRKTCAVSSTKASVWRSRRYHCTGGAVSGELGIGLLIKTLAITGGPGELADAARLQRAHLRGAADDDIGAVTAYMRSRDAAALRQAIEAPMRAARAAVAGLELCAKASGTVKSSLTADLGAAQALLGGALRAILICIDANLHHRTSSTGRGRTSIRGNG